MIRQPFSRRRQGFTLVEILVAAALTVLTMAILATAFQVGVNTLSHLRSVGSLAEQLRAAESTIRVELSSRHLVDSNQRPVMVSQAGQGWAGSGRGGYLLLKQTVNSEYEGVEEGVDSYRSGSCSFFFTTRTDSTSPAEAFTTEVGALASLQGVRDENIPEYAASTTFASPWAEVGYFLEPGAVQTSPNENATDSLQLYNLFRRQRVLAQRNAVVLRDETTTPTEVGTGEPKPNYVTPYPELSVSAAPKGLRDQPPTNLGRFAILNSPFSVSTPANRMYSPSYTYSGAKPATGIPDATSSLRFQSASSLYGTDLMISNVVSMQITVQMADATGTLIGAGRFLRLDDPLLNSYLGIGPWQFDTATTPSSSLRAVQIKLRIYDTKNRVTRQISITQDL